jgi:hypothetical protein
MQEVRNMDIAIHVVPSEDFPSNVEVVKITSANLTWSILRCIHLFYGGCERLFITRKTLLL